MSKFPPNQKTESLPLKVLDFLAFINQPISRRFKLFYAGVMLWFVIILVVSLGGFYRVDMLAKIISDETIPQEKSVQVIGKTMNKLSLGAGNLVGAESLKSAIEFTNGNLGQIKQIQNFLQVLKAGGEVGVSSTYNAAFTENIQRGTVHHGAEVLKDVSVLLDLLNTLAANYSDLSKVKLSALETGKNEEINLEKKLKAIQVYHKDAELRLNHLSFLFTQSYQNNFNRLFSVVIVTGGMVIASFFVAGLLLTLFTVRITSAISSPVNSIISQIQSLTEGTSEMTNKIEVTSRDEIGLLSKELNLLIDTIHSISRFKQVIEQDYNLIDVYSRLGHVFKSNDLGDFVIYEIEGKELKPVFPFMEKSETRCLDEVFTNCDLCRANRTGTVVSSIEYPSACKQFRLDLDKEHVCIPMNAGNVSVGVVQFLLPKKNYNDFERNETNQKIAIAKKYVMESLNVIQAKRLMNTLRDTSIKDELTGLYNRRFLQEFAEGMMGGIIRRGKNLGVMMCDMDYFKQVNDTYGHDVGDQVLIATSEIIKKSTRKADIVVRFGGEEFLILLIDIEEGESEKVAEKIRANIESTVLARTQDGPLEKTISLGVCEFPEDTDSLWKAIKFADTALYKAKEEGRNRVVRFDAAMWQEENF